MTRKKRDAAPRPVPTVIEFLLDETTSMTRIARATVDGFNQFLKEQRGPDGIALFTLTKFNTAVGATTPIEDIPVEMVPDLTLDTFLPDGGTNLRDNIARRLDAISDRLTSWDVRPNVLFIAMTDGEDNSSKVTVPTTRLAVEAATARGWTCVYLGADQAANVVGMSLGFPEGNCKSFASERVRETITELSGATTTYRSERATSNVAMAASTAYFTNGVSEDVREPHHKAVHTNADLFRGL